jgi:hypothetical protein
VRTVRTKVTDRMLMCGSRHLRAFLDEYAERYSRHRPHRARNLWPPDNSGDIVTGPGYRPGRRADTTPQGPRRADPRVPKSRMTVTSSVVTLQVRDNGRVSEPYRVFPKGGVPFVWVLDAELRSGPRQPGRAASRPAKAT